MILSALLVANISACNYVPENELENIAEHHTPSITNYNTSPSSQNTPFDIFTEPPVFSNYSDILREYKNLLIFKQEHDLSGAGAPYQKGEPIGIWETLIYSAQQTMAENAGYCIKDLNNDGISELILISSLYKIKAIFTMVNGSPQSLGEYSNGNEIVVIDETGKIYTSGYGKAENWYTTVEQLLEDGNLATLHFGCYDPNVNGNYDPLDLEYFQFYNGERTVIDENQLDELIQKYHVDFLNFGETLRCAGFEPTLLF